MQKPSKLFGRLGNTMFQMAYIYARHRKGAIPDIYIQDPAYFDEYAEEIKKWYGDDIGKINKVAIHVRRGDYVNNPFYVDLTETDYYEKAMAEFPDAQFLIFSDDIEWCKEYFIGDIDFDETIDEVDTLNKMASCTGHVVANSSFSWWGAFISPHGGKVIAPKSWYTDGIERTKCPKEWKRL